MRRAEKPFVEGDYKIEHVDHKRWRVSIYTKDWRNSQLYWDWDTSFEYRWQARMYVRRKIKEANRLHKAPEYWRA